MPKIRCVCDEVISLSEIPSPNQSMLISDIDLEPYFEVMDMYELYRRMKVVVHCHACGRLHIYYNGFDKDPVIYKLDR